MPITARIDEYGKGAWIALMILGFVVWWPLGLAILAFSIGSGRMGCSRHGDRWEHKMARMQDKMDRLRRARDGGQWWGGPPSSGNRAFDEYRAETLEGGRSEEHTSELQSLRHLVCRLLLEKK